MSKCLAFFVFVSFYKIQVKRQKIWLYSGTKSHSVEFLCLYLYHFLFGCHEDRRFNRRNDLKFISKFWLRFWGRKCNLPSRACFEWQSEISLRAVSFYSLCEKRRLREPPAEPLKELTHEFRPRLRWTKLFKTNPKGQTGQRREVTVSQDNRIRKWYTLKKFEMSMRKLLIQHFYPQYFSISLWV